ncbi:MAG TPA: preprotein translocase subunit YajC [Bacteroidaceae bacterium]|nr:preprotein translocase subunit YajC [Bacteroidaceae bacterium]
MAKFLLINPQEGIAQAVEMNNVNNFVQTEGVNLSEPVVDGAGAGSGKSGFNPMIMLVVLLVLMFVMMRPRKDKEGDKFRNALQEGQDVVTTSGIFGKVKEVDDVSATIEIAQNMRIKVDKRFVNPTPSAAPAKVAKKDKGPNKDEKAKY